MWIAIRKELGITELVYYPALAQLMQENEDEDDLKKRSIVTSMS